MKRLILGFSLVFASFGISTMHAQENAFNSDVANVLKQNEMSKSQAKFLFGTSNINHLNVEILSTQELQETQGKFWSWLFKWIKIPTIPVPVQSCCAAVKK